MTTDGALVLILRQLKVLSVCNDLVSQAYRWCIEAMKEITPGLPVKVVVDVLRQASKVTLTHVSIAQIGLRLNFHTSIPDTCVNCLFPAGLRGEKRVQKSRAADQTCSVSSKVTRWV